MLGSAVTMIMFSASAWATNSRRKGSPWMGAIARIFQLSEV
jgi:hypothetical protein